MTAFLINAGYLVAAVLFIFGLKGLTHPRTAVRGNLLMGRDEGRGDELLLDSREAVDISVAGRRHRDRDCGGGSAQCATHLKNVTPVHV